MPMNISTNVANGGTLPAGQNDLANYLQIIQGVIQRMSNMSFMIKGWVIAVFFAMMVNTGGQIPFAIVALFFWSLDAYYLAQERRFRLLYNLAAEDQSRVPLFLLDFNQLESYGIPKPKVRWLSTMISPTVALLHLPLIGLALWLYYAQGPGKQWWDQFVNSLQAML